MPVERALPINDRFHTARSMRLVVNYPFANHDQRLIALDKVIKEP